VVGRGGASRGGVERSDRGEERARLGLASAQQARRGGKKNAARNGNNRRETLESQKREKESAVEARMQSSSERSWRSPLDMDLQITWSARRRETAALRRGPP
jgi:hypothetical protein